MNRKVDYGIDAPREVRNFSLIAAVGVTAGLLMRLLAPMPWSRLGRIPISIGLWFGLSAAVMLWTSLFLKKRTREWLLSQHQWRGDERVLDAGCGRGLMLIGAAKRLTTGSATGIDLWSNVDQHSNSAEATRANAELEGVADRIELRTGDLRELPFDDATFDVVTSSFVVHNIHSSADRAKAMQELVRVLKPGGHIHPARPRIRARPARSRNEQREDELSDASLHAPEFQDCRGEVGARTACPQARRLPAVAFTKAGCPRACRLAACAPGA